MRDNPLLGTLFEKYELGTTTTDEREFEIAFVERVILDPQDNSMAHYTKQGLEIIDYEQAKKIIKECKEKQSISEIKENN